MKGRATKKLQSRVSLIPHQALTTRPVTASPGFITEFFLLKRLTTPFNSPASGGHWMYDQPQVKVSPAGGGRWW